MRYIKKIHQLKINESAPNLNLIDELKACGGYENFVESMTHAWESYNLALENDPLVTK